MARIVIGVPVYGNVSQEVYEDHCRFFYYLGRRYEEHDFYTAFKMKSEQFRARNAIVQAARQVDADYLLMIDDDMIINEDFTTTPTLHYEFLRRMLEHMQDNPGMGICGVLYYQRGNDCFPVMLHHNGQGVYQFLRDDEVVGGLQEVDVAGGGCLLIDMKIFDKLLEPWFAPEYEYGTDVQICTKAKDAGWRVFVDSSIELGHVDNRRRIVTSRNRHQVFADSKEEQSADYRMHDWYTEKPLQEYLQHAVEYLQLDPETIKRKAEGYWDTHFPNFDATDEETLREYYKAIGIDQVCRQVCYHFTGYARGFMQFVLQMFAPHKQRLLDFACGTGPIGYELARKGDDVTFVDLDGAGGFEFLKYRLHVNGIQATTFDSKDFLAHVTDPEEIGVAPFDAIILSDALEHFKDWRSVLDSLDLVLKDRGMIVTNYFEMNDDETNVEHISMDREAVEAYLKEKGIYKVNVFVLVKNLQVRAEEEKKKCQESKSAPSS